MLENRAERIQKQETWLMRLPASKLASRFVNPYPAVNSNNFFKKIEIRSLQMVGICGTISLVGRKWRNGRRARFRF